MSTLQTLVDVQLGDGAFTDDASIQVHGLAGNVLAELDVPVSMSIEDLKQKLKTRVVPNATESTEFTLFFEGAMPDDKQTLTGLGIVAGDQASFLVLVYDVELLAQTERARMYEDAVVKSRQEAAEARLVRAARKKQLGEALARQQLVSEPQIMLDEVLSPQQLSPPTLLMLTAEPANISHTGGSRGPCKTKKRQTDLMLPACEAKASPFVLPTTHMSAAVDLQAAASEVEAAYLCFFDHISFRKGWKQPPFHREEVSTAFLAAAQIVARARLEVLDSVGGIKLRQVEGSARDWLHDPAAASLLREDRRRFVAALVHATFRDVHGYVEGLSDIEVDAFIASFGDLSEC